MVALISVSPDGIDLGSKSVTFISEPDTDFGVGKRPDFRVVGRCRIVGPNTMSPGGRESGPRKTNHQQ